MEKKSKAGRPKGKPKTGGRLPGVGNKVGSDAKQKIADFLESRLDNLDDIYNNLPNAVEQSKFVLGLLPYIVSKEVQKIDVTSEGDKLMNWTITPVKRVEED